jgi:hypothetical protein
MNQLPDQIFEKLESVKREVAAEKGPFRFFALFLREDSPNRWDLLVSAPWLEADQVNGIDYLARRIQSELDTEEVLLLSRVVFIGEHTPGLQSILRAIKVQSGRVELGAGNYFGLEIRRAYIFAADDSQTADWPTSQELIRSL